MQEIVLDCVRDTVKLVPFLFVTYLLMEYIEHRSSDGMLRVIRRAGRMGPLLGGVLGIVPQCGFSAAAAGFFAGRVITAGTLLAVFLSTSDEMLPILLSSQVPPRTIVRIIMFKAACAVIIGFLADFLFRRFNRRTIGGSIRDLCEHDKCRCEKNSNILLSALYHTLQITVFIFLVSFLLGFAINSIGEENLGKIILNRPVMGEVIAGMAGLIPNCAASVVITTLYMEGAMSTGAMMTGLMVGAGVGLLILFRTNHSFRENLQITGLLYGSGVACGLLLDLFGISF